MDLKAVPSVSIKYLMETRNVNGCAYTHIIGVHSGGARILTQGQHNLVPFIVL